MESIAQPQATLVDLLDRILDRGLIINADIIISLAGVPLIGIKLRAALAGMETMTRYGLMQEWDQKIRIREAQQRMTPQVHLMAQDESLAGMEAEASRT